MKYKELRNLSGKKFYKRLEELQERGWRVVSMWKDKMDFSYYYHADLIK